MIKSKAKELYVFLSNKINKKKLHEFYLKKISKLLDIFITFLGSWWQILIISIFAFLFLYYPIGGLIVHNIDKNLDYEIKPNERKSTTLELSSFLINRETDDHIWTANLPIIFPSYFLDNMPSFQLGMISAISETISALSKRITPSIDTEASHFLKNAENLNNITAEYRCLHKP